MANYKAFRAARKYGYRSGLEHKISVYLEEHSVSYEYEKLKIEWEDLAYRTYTPDFVLCNGIIIETKGMFTAADRRKHLAVKKQHPSLDIRFVFENSRQILPVRTILGIGRAEIELTIVLQEQDPIFVNTSAKLHRRSYELLPLDQQFLM